MRMRRALIATAVLSIVALVVWGGVLAAAPFLDPDAAVRFTLRTLQDGRIELHVRVDPAELPHNGRTHLTGPLRRSVSLVLPLGAAESARARFNALPASCPGSDPCEAPPPPPGSGAPPSRLLVVRAL